MNFVTTFAASYAARVITTGLAMFAMFFGAGNVVFPLIVGKAVGSQSVAAVAGLFVTAVGVPFMGLVALTLYNGDYMAFLGRLGAKAGFVLAFFMLLVLGPIGAIPRCVALSCGTLQVYYPHLSTLLFSFIASLVIYAATCRKNRLVGIIGAFLSPILLGSLVEIIVRSLCAQPAGVVDVMSGSEAFLFGISQGYNTMDLLAAVFFAGVAMRSVHEAQATRNLSQREAMHFTLISSVVGATLLGLVYAGFVCVAARHAVLLWPLKAEALLSALAQLVLGSSGGFLVSMTVVLACLTTAITLAAVFAEFLHEQLFAKRLSYQMSLLITVAVTFVFSNLGFGTIVGMLVPALVVIYPGLIVLTAVNIVHKLYGFRPVKTPFAVATAAAILWLYGLPW